MNNFRRLCRGLCLVLAAVCLSYADEPPQTNPPSKTQKQSEENGAVSTEASDGQRPVLQHRNPRYQLCKDDVLQLDFPVTPEFNQTVMVQPDGYITLQTAGDIYVEGQTLPEATQTIRAAYAGILRKPIITVYLKDFEKPYFVVGGLVGKPGKYDLRGDTTVVQAIEIGGGFTDASKHSQVWLFRRVSNDWVETRKLDVKKMLHDGNLSEDMHLRPGDMLYVPKNTLSKIKPFLPVASLGTYIPL